MFGDIMMRRNNRIALVDVVPRYMLEESPALSKKHADTASGYS
jgi:hypothetical protein